MAGGALCQAGRENGLAHGGLHHGLVQVVAPTLASLSTHVGARRGHAPLRRQCAEERRYLMAPDADAVESSNVRGFSCEMRP